MTHFTTADFEDKILNPLELNQSYQPLHFLSEEIGDLFSEYLSMLRKELTKEQFCQHPPVKRLIGYILSLYFEDGKLNKRKYVYTEIHRYAKKVLEEFSKRELFCITYDVIESSSKTITEIQRDCLKPNNRLDIRFPPCLSESFISTEQLCSILEETDFKASEYQSITDLVDNSQGFIFWLCPEKLKGIILDFVHAQKSEEYGLLDELYQLANNHCSTYDYAISENKIFGNNLLKATVDTLNELGHDVVIKLHCPELIDENEPVELQNHNAITLIMIVMGQTETISSRSKKSLDNVAPGYLDAQFLDAMADFIISNNNQLEHDDSLLDRILHEPLLTVIIDKLELGNYQGEPLKITMRFINSVLRGFECIDFMKRDGLFDVEWPDYDGSPKSWEELISKRCIQELTEENSLKDNLNTQDYYRLVLAFDENTLTSKSFLDVCNQNKEHVFSDENGKYSHLKKEAISVLKKQI
ncbi:hypothetical protein [Vibrio owensii]|uniref:hypothetical protein n=1 Tax=Vibrio harveyi group TaxID=717610 RepID=UPI003CC59C39